MFWRLFVVVFRLFVCLSFFSYICTNRLQRWHVYKSMTNQHLQMNPHASMGSRLLCFNQMARTNSLDVSFRRQHTCWLCFLITLSRCCVELLFLRVQVYNFKLFFFNHKQACVDCGSRAHRPCLFWVDPNNWQPLYPSSLSAMVLKLLLILL